MNAINLQEDLMSVTEFVFHDPIPSPVKEDASLNMSLMSLTETVFHEPIPCPVNEDAPQNIALMSGRHRCRRGRTGGQRTPPRPGRPWRGSWRLR